jgi:hypothetical protein
MCLSFYRHALLPLGLCVVLQGLSVVPQQLVFRVFPRCTRWPKKRLYNIKKKFDFIFKNLILKLNVVGGLDWCSFAPGTTLRYQKSAVNSTEKKSAFTWATSFLLRSLSAEQLEPPSICSATVKRLYR